MSKLSDLTGTTAFLNSHPYIDTGLKATGFGAGAYATMALIREFLDMMDDRKDEKRRNKPKTDKDTIVITLPNTVKGASAREAILEYAKIRRKPPEDEDAKSEVRQARNADGTFARGFDVTLSKDAAEKRAILGMEFDLGRAGGIGMDLASAAGGTVVGWLLMQQVHDFLKQKRLKREIAAAQKEYIDTLMPKAAETAPAFSPDYSGLTPANAAPPSPKSPLQSGAEQFTGGVFGLSLLLAMASSVITKKWLDDRFKDPQVPKDKTKVKNIVFKTASGGPPLECDAVDVIAYAKVASIAMELPVEKVAADGNTFMFYGTPISADELDYLSGLPGINEAVLRTAKGAVPQIFNGLGMSGEDQSKWKFDTTFGGNSQIDPAHANILRMLLRPPDGVPDSFKTLAHDAKEAFQNEFMDPKYAPQRTFIARNVIGQHLNRFNNSELGKSWVGQMLSPLLTWLGNTGADYLGNSGWGSRYMYDQMEQSLVDRLNAAQDAPVAGQAAPVTQPAAGSQTAAGAPSPQAVAPVAQPAAGVAPAKPAATIPPAPADPNAAKPAPGGTRAAAGQPVQPPPIDQTRRAGT